MAKLFKASTYRREHVTHGQAQFKISLEDCLTRSGDGTNADRQSLTAMADYVRSKQVSPGDALSCFKSFIKSGSPTEQYSTLQILRQFVAFDPSLSHQLHAELASKRWKERFVTLGNTSLNPAVRPALISMLQSWAATYQGHDWGVMYNNMLQEIGTGIAYSSQYTSQYTGQYTGQQTGPGRQYIGQQTGAGRPGYNTYPPAHYGGVHSASSGGGGGYPTPSHPAVGGQGSFYGYGSGPGSPTAYGAAHHAGYPAYGAPVPPQAEAAPRRNDPQVLSRQLDALQSCVSGLSEATAAAERVLADYQSGRVQFAALQAALDTAARAASKAGAAQGTMEEALGHADVGDEALMARMLSANDGAVTALEKWRALTSQELAAPGAEVTSGAVAGARPSGHTPLGDLIAIDDDGPISPSPSLPTQHHALPPPLPLAAAPPAAPSSAHAAAQAHAPAVDGMIDVFAASNGAAAAGAGAASSYGAGGGNALAGSTGAMPSSADGPLPAVGATPSFRKSTAGSLDASAAWVHLDLSGPPEAQVSVLKAELARVARVNATAVEANEAFHKAEVQQVKSQALARVQELTQRHADLEATVSRLNAELAQARGQVGPGAVPPYSTQPTPVPAPYQAMPTGYGASMNPAPLGMFSPTSAGGASIGVSSLSGGGGPAGSLGAAATMPLPMSANNPFASALAPMPTMPAPAAHMYNVPAPMASPLLAPAAPAPAPPAAGAMDGFDELLKASSMRTSTNAFSGGGGGGGGAPMSVMSAAAGPTGAMPIAAGPTGAQLPAAAGPTGGASGMVFAVQTAPPATPPVAAASPTGVVTQGGPMPAMAGATQAGATSWIGF